MKLLINIVLLVIVIVCSIIMESYLPFVSMLVSYCLAFILILLDDIEQYVAGLVWAIAIIVLWMLPFILYDASVRVVKKGAKIAVVSPLYPIGRIIAEGDKIDTLKKVARCFESNGNESNIHYEDFFRLQCNDGQTTIMCKCGFVVLCGRNVMLESRQFHLGMLNICSFIDKNGLLHYVDMDGNDINGKGYCPKIIDTSPIIVY